MGSDRYTLAELRQWKYFENLQGHAKLFWWAFTNGHAQVNICVARLALPVILRNLFNRKKIIVVWHYYDPYDGKSKSLKRWYHWLVQLSVFIPKSKLAFVAVAPFWETYFKTYFKLKKVFLFPNFFDPLVYTKHIGTSKKNQIHLGQVSFKNSYELFLLAQKLKEKGYDCYFSTNDPEKVHTHANYTVKYFEKHEDYLKEMAASRYTLAMPFIREGWNRIAHESLLVDTPVIGFAKGGLGDLLVGSGSKIVGELEKEDHSTEMYRDLLESGPVNLVKQALDYIEKNENQNTFHPFLSQFEISQTGNYLLPILDWCRKK